MDNGTANPPIAIVGARDDEANRSLEGETPTK